MNYKLDTRTEGQWYADQTEARLRCMATGAWDANDRHGFCMAHAELRRRRENGTNLRDFYIDSWQQG